MIIGPVEIQKLLIGKLGNHLRVAAGLHPVGGVRIQKTCNLSPQHTFGGGEGTLHLIVNDAVVDQLSVLIQLIVPAFLTKDRFVGINVRIEHCIQIHMHQVLKILVIAACDRINGLIRIGHGI